MITVTGNWSLPPGKRKKLLRDVGAALEHRETIISLTGQSLAVAVEWCETHGKSYTITGVPGIGYTLRLGT